MAHAAVPDAALPPCQWLGAEGNEVPDDDCRWACMISHHQQPAIQVSNLRGFRPEVPTPDVIHFYKDRGHGGPLAAQLGTRDCAGLKGHGADRDLARYGGQKRAAPGEVKSHARHTAPSAKKWDLGRL
jgi:hypothetical protein